jgi:hypothetical protein
VNQAVDILCRARELYAAAPSHAAPCEMPDPGTRCVIFALRDAAGGSWTGAHQGVLAALEKAMGNPILGPVPWNAEHTTEEVLAAFDRAIAAQRLIVPPLQHAGQRIPVHAGQES